MINVKFQEFLLKKNQNFSLSMTSIVEKLVEVISSIKNQLKIHPKIPKSYRDLQKILRIFGTNIRYTFRLL